MSTFSHSAKTADALEDIRHAYLAYAALESLLEPDQMLRGDRLEIRTEEIAALVRTLNRSLHSTIAHMERLIQEDEPTPEFTGNRGGTLSIGASVASLPQIPRRKVSKG